MENSDIKFYENPSSGSRVDLCGRTDKQTDGGITKLTVALRIFRMRLKHLIKNVSKNFLKFSHYSYITFQGITLKALN
jgi:hypothetical protein